MPRAVFKVQINHSCISHTTGLYGLRKVRRETKSSTPHATSSAPRATDRSSGKRIYQSCKPRSGIKNPSRTYGTGWLFCVCGFEFPHVEFMSPESCSQKHFFLCRWFDGMSLRPRAEHRLIVGHDDACHLKPYTTNQTRLECAPTIAHQFATDVDQVGKYDHRHDVWGRGGGGG
jgi:hypothetical protein